MSPEDVRETLAIIEGAAGDPERAHLLEDALYVAVLAAVAAEECEDPAATAAEALSAFRIEFPRWYA